MALTTEQLETMRDALQTAMYKGIRSITMQDRTISYASTDDMRKALNDLNDQITSASATSSTTRRSYAAFSKS